MAKTSEIKFVPICSNCRRELRTIIDYSIDYSDGIMVNHTIQPYQCPVCKSIFTSITIPCRLPVDNRIPDPPMRISKDLIQYPEPKEDVYSVAEDTNVPSIVRCKDCLYYDNESFECKNDPSFSPDPNWFCADGERR